MPSPKFNLRLPPDLQQRAADLAQAQGISLNAFITLAVGSWVDYQTKKRPPTASAGLQAPTAPAPRTNRVISKADDFTPYRAPPKVGRNDPCPCGSGKKYKACHGAGA